MADIEESDDFEHENNEGNEIPIESIDELRDTYITIGCYRQTTRLDRMLRVFQKALTLARISGIDDKLVENLVGLHDRKGILTVTWKTEAAGYALKCFVDASWHNEHEGAIHHEVDGVVFHVDDVREMRDYEITQLRNLGI